MSKTIIIVEDNEEHIENLKGSLLSRGYNVRTAQIFQTVQQTISSIMEEISSAQFADIIVLLDHYLWGDRLLPFCGSDVYSGLKNQNGHIDFVSISSASQSSQQRYMDNAGIMYDSSYLQIKHFEDKSLLRWYFEALERNNSELIYHTEALENLVSLF